MRRKTPQLRLYFPVYQNRRGDVGFRVSGRNKLPRAAKGASDVP
jgi:hypothetical protein